MSLLLAIQRMAARRRTLHVLRQQSLQLRHPHFRARALLSVVRAALSIDRELARWQDPHVRSRWAEHYLALCTSDLSRVPALAGPLRFEPSALSSWAANSVNGEASMDLYFRKLDRASVGRAR